MGSEEQQRDVVIESVINRLEDKKIRVTYYARETVYYATTVEAYTREEADNKYYGGEIDLDPVDSANFETYDIEEEEL